MIEWSTPPPGHPHGRWRSSLCSSNEPAGLALHEPESIQIHRWTIIFIPSTCVWNIFELYQTATELRVFTYGLTPLIAGKSCRCQQEGSSTSTYWREEMSSKSLAGRWVRFLWSVVLWFDAWHDVIAKAMKKASLSKLVLVHQFILVCLLGPTCFSCLIP